MVPGAGTRAGLRRFGAVDEGSVVGRLRRAALVASAACVSILGSACEVPPDFVTPRGAAFFLNGSELIAPSEVADQELRFVERLEEAGLADRGECWSQVQVHIAPGGAFPCAGAVNTTCAGEQYGPHLKVADAAPEDSAWRHELLHWLLECRGLAPDHAHAGEVWRLVD